MNEIIYTVENIDLQQSIEETNIDEDIDELIIKNEMFIMIILTYKGGNQVIGADIGISSV